MDGEEAEVTRRRARPPMADPATWLGAMPSGVLRRNDLEKPARLSLCLTRCRVCCLRGALPSGAPCSFYKQRGATKAGCVPRLSLACRPGSAGELRGVGRAANLGAWRVSVL